MEILVFGALGLAIVWGVLDRFRGSREVAACPTCGRPFAYERRGRSRHRIPKGIWGLPK